MRKHVVRIGETGNTPTYWELGDDTQVHSGIITGDAGSGKTTTMGTIYDAMVDSSWAMPIVVDPVHAASEVDDALDWVATELGRRMVLPSGAGLPALVLFIDEAATLFRQASHARLDLVERIARTHVRIGVVATMQRTTLDDFAGRASLRGALASQHVELSALVLASA